MKQRKDEKDRRAQPESEGAPPPENNVQSSDNQNSAGGENVVSHNAIRRPHSRSPGEQHSNMQDAIEMAALPGPSARTNAEEGSPPSQHIAINIDGEDKNDTQQVTTLAGTHSTSSEENTLNLKALFPDTSDDDSKSSRHSSLSSNPSTVRKRKDDSPGSKRKNITNITRL